jgi:uncharacterized protein YndB with AHSA1/START domain
MMSNVFPFRPRRETWATLYRRHWLHRLDRLEIHLSTIRKGDLDMPALTLIAPKDEPIITGAEPRSLAAPAALVWKCFSEREHVARWWGPESIGKLVVKDFDFRVGGTWRFDHAMKRGPVITFHGTYRAIEPITRIVNTFGVEGMFEGSEVEETHLFEAYGETTLYSSILRFSDFESRDGMIAAGMEKGAEESMRQLEALLAALQETAK